MSSQIKKVLWPTWGPPGSCRPQMGPMMSPWTLLWGISYCAKMTLTSIVSEVWPGLDNCSFNCCSSIVACLERVIRYEVVRIVAPYQEYISLYKAWIRVWYLGYDWDQNYCIATDYPNIWLGVLFCNHKKNPKTQLDSDLTLVIFLPFSKHNPDSKIISESRGRLPTKCCTPISLTLTNNSTYVLCIGRKIKILWVTRYSYPTFRWPKAV